MYNLPEIIQNTLAVVPLPLPAPVMMLKRKECFTSSPLVQSTVTNRFYGYKNIDCVKSKQMLYKPLS